MVNPKTGKPDARLKVDPDIKEEFARGRKNKFARERGVSLRKLAGKLGISDCYLNRILHGRHKRPDPGLFADIARALGMTVEQLYNAVYLPVGKLHRDKQKHKAEFDLRWKVWRERAKRNHG